MRGQSARIHAVPGAFFYDVIGQVVVNLMHRLLSNREFGLSAYKQAIVLNSQVESKKGVDFV